MRSHGRQLCCVLLYPLSVLFHLFSSHALQMTKSKNFVKLFYELLFEECLGKGDSFQRIACSHCQCQINRYHRR